MGKKLVAVMVLTVMLLGCRRWMAAPEPEVRFVRSITVVCEEGKNATRYFYNTDAKMRHILHFIRHIGIQDIPDTDPESLEVLTVCVTVDFSDGTQKLYRMKGNRYFQEDTSPWKQISLENGSALYNAILETPGDPEHTRNFRLPHSFLGKRPR